MKSLVITSLFLTLAGSISAQSEDGFDVRIITTQIIEKLTPALSLTEEQKPQVENTISEFLTKKERILPLQKTDSSSYSSKFNILNGSLIGKLTTILFAKQMTSFLGLKPKTNNPTNVLSHLFY